jgi:hypothetical protein
MNFSPAILLLASMATVALAQYKVTNNPYEGVNWETYGKHKAAFHVHSTYSDGTNTADSMLITHYDRDFSIVTMTDHGTFTEDWDIEPRKGATDEGNLAGYYSSKGTRYLSNEQKKQINDGTQESSSRSPTLGGMIGLKCTSELLAWTYMYTVDDPHIDVGHSFSAGACFSYSGKDSITKVLKASTAAGGINYIHHPGRYTGGGYEKDSAAGATISNNQTYIDKYVKILKETSALGMEIMNKLDNESKSDRVFYDNILKALAPEKRNVWAFSSDDSHSQDEIGYSFNVMLLPELTQAATIESMKKGAFYAVARVDRREGIHIRTPAGKETPNRGEPATLVWLNQPVPNIKKIEVNKESGIITITGEDYDIIEWIADGVKILSENRIPAGNTLNLNDSKYTGKIGRYVRAHLKSSTGIAYTQPFYVHNPEVKVTPWYTIPTGLDALEGSKLSSVKLPAGWTWVDGTQTIEDIGTHPYEAIFTPSDLSIYNTETVNVNVTGKPAGLNIYEVSKSGDYYYYQSRTNAKFLDGAFDILSVNGWTNAPTSIGFGNTPTPTTAIPIATPRHTWTYFKKQFIIDNKNFNSSEIMSVTGKHKIDDAMIMYINGTEVYRFNTSSSSTQIGATVEWDKYAGNSVGTAASIDFAINSDYDNKVISGSGTSALRDAASLTNLKKALKPGINVITCLVGQQSSTSSDLFFDLQMSITVNEKNPQPLTKINGVVPKQATYTYNGSEQKPVLMLGNIELKEGVDYTATYTNNVNAGATDEAKVEIIGKGAYIGNAAFSFTINKANQPDLNITPVTGKKFGDAAFDVSATGGIIGAITYELVSGPGTVASGGKVTIAGAGNIVVKATRAGNDNYKPVVSTESTISIAKASLTLTAENKTISVGDPAPTYTYTVSGLIGTDTKEGIITTQPTLSVASFSSSVANKTFDITISGGATTSPNYNVAALTKGTLTIKDKATVTISGLSAKDGTYNGSAHAGYTGTATFAGGNPTTALTANYTGRSGTTYSSTSTAPANAGNYTIKLTLDNDPGYKGEISLDFTINKASLTLKADDKTISVGDPAPTYTYTVSGLIGTDTKEGIITTQPTLSVASFSSSAAKTFDITISGGATTSQNYAIATRTIGKLTVANKTAVTIEGLSAQSGPYNGKPRTGYTGTATFKNGSASVTPTIATLAANYTGRDGTTYSSTSTAPTNAGNYKVALSLDNDPVYKGAAANINFTINKASLTLKADDKTIFIGDPTPTYTYTVSGLVSPDTKGSTITAQPTLSVANFSSLAAKTFDIAISGGATSNPNYTITARTNGTLTVNSSIPDQSSSSGEPTPIIRLPQIASSNHITQIKNGINLMAANRAVVQIYGLDGNLIQKQNFKSGVYSISLTHLPKGIYIAKASFGSETKILRVVVR